MVNIQSHNDDDQTRHFRLSLNGFIFILIQKWTVSLLLN